MMTELDDLDEAQVKTLKMLILQRQKFAGISGIYNKKRTKLRFCNKISGFSNFTIWK